MVQTKDNCPESHPDPPGDLHKKELPIIDCSIPFFRIDKKHHETPLYFGRSGDNRFDAPDEEFGILYLAKDEYCAVRETLGKLSRFGPIAEEALKQHRLSQIEANYPLNLVDLTGPGLTAEGGHRRHRLLKAVYR